MRFQQVIFGNLISIHALREEGDGLLRLATKAYNISIHALREEGDSVAKHQPEGTVNFNPRPP